MRLIVGSDDRENGANEKPFAANLDEWALHVLVNVPELRQSLLRSVRPFVRP
ncbi:Uncharacterised protein [Vibrio cholerae]|nr:Uncharacterised protein [Vibrio cholerae]CSC22306.1 Uncharacterised protein [Vibrio cholerae]